MSNYKVSVITPFNNTKLKYFDECAQHMINQTIGFSNVEWIVIMHNCDDGFYEEVNKRIGKYKNVTLKEIHNDIHTASSPRNYALGLVTSDYIVFLDSDDYLSDDCLEVSYNAIRQTKAQIVGFRRAFVASKPGLFPMVDEVLWNSSEKLIVAEKDSWDEEIVFYRDFLFTTSHIFESKLINDNGFRYDEDIILAEDMHFMLQLLPKLNKIAFLPQHIGYTYYLHESSTIQKPTKTDEELLSFARGFNKIFNIDKQYGTHSLALYSCLPMLANYILNSPDIKVETRIEIKNLLEEAVLSSLDKIKDDYHREISKATILNPINPWKSEFVINTINGKNVLMDILKRNQYCDFGKHHHFETIDDLSTYQNNVPLQTSEDYSPMIDLHRRVGVDKILTRHKVKRFIQKDNGELIPWTNEHAREYVLSFAELLRDNHNFLIARCKKVIGTCNNGAVIKDFQSIIIRDYFFEYLDSLLKEDASFSSKKETYFVDGQDSEYRKLLLDALLDTEIEQIAALNTNEILNCFDFLKNNHEVLVKDIEKVNSDRANELKTIFDDGFVDVARRIWPKLKKVVGFGAGELYESNRAIKEYIGDINHNHGYYYTEEAILGKAVEDNSDLFESNMSNCFYELLPVGKTINTNNAILLTDAELHKTYQLVITNYSGLYRYVTDHFISIKEKEFDCVRYIVY
ncbi:MAG: GH3 auxin-responsive promoter family protein [Erysipelotrichaceae bacterium]|nr:GH3 auxin-responsive promoter family protein [Erysipelotrichaceae bacterium]